MEEKVGREVIRKIFCEFKRGYFFEVYRALGETVISFIARDWYETKRKIL